MCLSLSVCVFVCVCVCMSYSLPSSPLGLASSSFCSSGSSSSSSSHGGSSSSSSSSNRSRSGSTISNSTSCYSTLPSSVQLDVKSRLRRLEFCFQRIRVTYLNRPIWSRIMGKFSLQLKEIVQATNRTSNNQLAPLFSNIPSSN